MNPILKIFKKEVNSVGLQAPGTSLEALYQKIKAE